MKLTEELKMEILDINIDSINMVEEDAFIKVDEITYNMWMSKLEYEERYEDCLKLLENKNKIITTN